jgi:hypothetical protein
MVTSWLHEQGPVDWHDFELASEAGKEILERLAGDRSLLRELIFTAYESPGAGDFGSWAESGGEIELFVDASRRIFIYLHVGLSERVGEAVQHDASYVGKVLSGAYKHVWHADARVAYVTDEQPPGLYAMRAGLTHSLSWVNGSTALLLRETRASATDSDEASLSEDRYVAIRDQADLAGIA